MYRRPPVSFDMGGFFLYYVILEVGGSCNCTIKCRHWKTSKSSYCTLPDNKEGYTMADQTSNEISHVQSVNRGREAQRSKIKTNLSAETQATLQKNTEELGVDVVKKQISIFFKTPFDQLKKL